MFKMSYLSATYLVHFKHNLPEVYDLNVFVAIVVLDKNSPLQTIFIIIILLCSRLELVFENVQTLILSS